MAARLGTSRTFQYIIELVVQLWALPFKFWLGFVQNRQILQFLVFRMNFIEQCILKILKWMPKIVLVHSTPSPILWFGSKTKINTTLCYKVFQNDIAEHSANGEANHLNIMVKTESPVLTKMISCGTLTKIRDFNFQSDTMDPPCKMNLWGLHRRVSSKLCDRVTVLWNKPITYVWNKIIVIGTGPTKFIVGLQSTADQSKQQR